MKELDLDVSDVAGLRRFTASEMACIVLCAPEKSGMQGIRGGHSCDVRGAIPRGIKQ